ncbi:restriction endonuclease, partial [Lactobacillus sp. ESL0233]|uniref:hypothetical protein n=1 Tax=Lactobacillus sp. ESL0233 TaxID=2069354 RepID=UPI000F275B2A
MDINTFKKNIKSNRDQIIKPYDLVFQEFQKLGIDQMTREEIIPQVSKLIAKLRNNTWEAFKPLEKKFTVKMITELAKNDTTYSEGQKDNQTRIEIISSFIENYSDYIYQLTLSNTNSRRSRAGKEFEAILELLLMACNITMDSQGSVGRKEFKDKRLG